MSETDFSSFLGCETLFSCAISGNRLFVISTGCETGAAVSGADLLVSSVVTRAVVG